MKIEDKEMKKVVAILGGGDWADASVSHLIKLVDRETGDLQREYMDAGDYHGTGSWFDKWLVEKGYCREPEDDELEIYYED